jgi:hypothetical protein
MKPMPGIHLRVQHGACHQPNHRRTDGTATKRQDDRSHARPFGNADTYTPPNIIIEKAELIHYVSDPSYYDETVEPTQLYLQPVWYFQGHNENGDEVNIYIQALKQEYLLPETSKKLSGSS